MAEKKILGGITYCGYDRVKKVLVVVGWTLPSPSKVELFINGKRIGEVRLGLSSPYIHNQYPEYEEKNAAWIYGDLLKLEDDAILEARAIYTDGRVQSWNKRCGEPNEKRFGKIEKCILDTDSRKMYIEGWFLPVPDEVEIYAGETKIGEAELGIERERIFSILPEFHDRYCGWRFRKNDNVIETGKLSVRLHYGEYMQELVCEPQKGDLWEGRAQIELCAYNPRKRILQMKGWILPHPRRIQIWQNGSVIGEPKMNIAKPYVYQRYPEFHEKNAGWQYCGAVDIEDGGHINIEATYADGFLKRWSNIDIEVFEEEPIIQVNNAMIARNRLIVEGWALPRADKIEIWGKECLGTAQIGIESQSVYHNYALYGEQCAGWAFGKELEEEIKELRIRMFRGGICCAECTAVVENGFQIKKGRVTSGKYNIFTSELKIEGWYLPKADAVEIWMNDKRHGMAEMGISSLGVDASYSAYGEKNVRWCFKRLEEQINSDRVQIRVIYQDRVVYKEDVAIEEENPKVVSFDIFDTLLVRPVWRPVDLFKIVALRMGYSKNFQKMRMISEQIAREKSKEEDITIQEIYNQMLLLFGIGQEECGKLLQCELQVEKDYLRPRKYGKKLFQRALDQEKEIILVSDMYLPKEFLEEVMQESGYWGFRKLYVSGSERISKGSGHLYDRILQEYEERGINAGEILHVGDNPQADISIPNKKGMQTFYVMCTRTAFQNVPLFDRYVKNVKNEMDNTFLVGFLANMLFDDPFKEYDDGSILSGRLEESGKILFASFLLEYTIWMLREMDKEGISELLLAYRDGYLIERILGELLPYWGKEYHQERLYLSRTVRYNAYARMQNGFFEALVEYPINGMSIRDFVRKRLLIEEETECKQAIALICGILNKSEEEGIENDSEMAQIVSHISRYYYEHAGKNMEIIDAYCKEKLQGGRKAVFDIGYRGRTVNFLINNYQADVIGYQLFAYSMMDKHEQGCQNTHTFIRYGLGTVNQLGILHHLFEEILCAQEGTAFKIVMQGNEYLIEREKADYREIIDKIQDEIVEFIRSFMDIVKADIKLMEFDRYAEFDLISDFLRNPCEKDARCIRNMVFEDSEFIRKAGKYAFLNWYNGLFGEGEECNNSERKLQ